MAEVHALIDTEKTYLTLGSRGMHIEIRRGKPHHDKVVGTLYISKAGIGWISKGKRSRLKGRYRVGKRLTWAQLDRLP